MLSYQHLYHAGNRADVHKHALLAVALDYVVQKPKPLTYLETHAGRGRYDLAAPEAVRTGEAAYGVQELLPRFAPAHPYRRAIEAVRQRYGPAAYPGSPLLAVELLRPMDRIELAELHPQEFAALSAAVGRRAQVHRQDGFLLANALCPPTPRRGLLLCDPSFEVKDDFRRAPEFLRRIARKWNVGVLMLWYPILPTEPHRPMIADLVASFPAALRSECRFRQLTPGKGIQGSGMFVINPPFGFGPAARPIEALVSAV